MREHKRKATKNGIIQFFKEKETTGANPRRKKVEKQTEQYLGDLNKTNVLAHLVQTPVDERDEAWRNTFLQNIGQASFCCGEPQVITGPDGFPYFQLFLPEPNKSFQCFVIEKMKDDFLLNAGFGVVINPTQNCADWVLSYGDILNYHLNKVYYTTEETAFSRERNDEIIPENEKIMIGQPSETLLPHATRQLISKYLKRNGIENPKVLLMMRNRGDGIGVKQDIAFNLKPEDFENESIYRGVMQTISWYLPRHYSFIGIDETTFGDNFMAL